LKRLDVKWNEKTNVARNALMDKVNAAPRVLRRTIWNRLIGFFV